MNQQDTFYNILNSNIVSNEKDLKDFLRISSKYSTDLACLDTIGQIQSKIKDYENCISTLHRCIDTATTPQQITAIRINLAKTYNLINDPQKAIQQLLYIQKVLQNNDSDILMELSLSYYLSANYNKSKEILESILEVENIPEKLKNRVEYNLATYRIAEGQFKKGLADYVYKGCAIGIWKTIEIDNIPMWDGTIRENSTLYIFGEGGIGDEIVCFRFAKYLKQIGITPVWITTRPDLKDIFEQHGVDTLLDKSKITKTKNSYRCNSMMLPVLLDLDETQVWFGSYLKPSDEYLTKWEELLPQGKKLACKWEGSPYYEQQLHRSIPFEYIDHLQFDGTKINLQLEPSNAKSNMFNAGQYINHINDTLAILYLCDLTVTSCTSIVHIAGAMDCSTIVCPPVAAYYVWINCKNNKSYWYSDKVKVFQQQQHKNWENVFTQVQQEIINEQFI